MVIMNKNAEGKKINTERFKEILAGKTIGTEIISGKKIALNGSLKISGKTAMVLELN
jgi:hypothetical protein